MTSTHDSNRALRYFLHKCKKVGLNRQQAQEIEWWMRQFFDMFTETELLIDWGAANNRTAWMVGDEIYGEQEDDGLGIM